MLRKIRIVETSSISLEELQAKLGLQGSIMRVITEPPNVSFQYARTLTFITERDGKWLETGS